MHASYGAAMRSLHWLTLALIVALYILGWTMDDLSREWRGPVLQVHRSLGITVLSLTLARLVWRFALGVPGSPPDLNALQRLAVRLTHGTLYVLLLAQPVVGWLWSSARGNAVNFYFLVQLPPFFERDTQLAKTLGHLHGLIATILLVLIGLHAAAALYHHFVRRDDVLRRMLGSGSR